MWFVWQNFSWKGDVKKVLLLHTSATFSVKSVVRNLLWIIIKIVICRLTPKSNTLNVIFAVRSLLKKEVWLIILEPIYKENIMAVRLTQASGRNKNVYSSHKDLIKKNQPELEFKIPRSIVNNYLT